MAQEKKLDDITAYNTTINAYAIIGDAHSAVRIFEAAVARGLQVDSFSYGNVIAAYCSTSTPAKRIASRSQVDNKNLIQAEQWFERFVNDENCDPPSEVVYGHMATGYAKRGDPAGAQSWFYRCQEANLQPKVECYSAVMNAYALRGDAPGAVKWLLAATEAGVKLDLMSYNTVLSAHGRAGDVRGAEGVFRALQESNLEPDVFSYSSLLNAYSGRGVHEEAWEILSGMKVPPNLVCYNAVIAACAKSRSSSAAEKYFCELQGANLLPDGYTYSTMISLFAKNNQPDQAKEWFERMEQSGVKLDQQVFGAVISSFQRVRDAEAALFWLEKMDKALGFVDLASVSSALRACLPRTRSAVPVQHDTKVPEQIVRVLVRSIRSEDQIRGVVGGLLTDLLGAQRLDELLAELRVASKDRPNRSP